ncbi:2-amino-4-hydroxy-6-hydroxymethyldihydropteridine diphosphokinase [Oceaniserpentilla sp. 4NH20-0058]|uniref:2-amino-4-hydroxy-6- hydroxymethyldihydropteridine diphosphokinase n=1 Tax=Oceaniserpentilla sp. 4NH20-0058 TaxID=3127660 RepID=UPI003101D098
MKSWVDIYIGLGSNLDQPLQHVEQAFQSLASHKHFQNAKLSGIYQSKPVGPQDQPDFINAVAHAQTQLGPHDVLDCLQSIENVHGRVRLRHWGERSLDLDLLMYGQAQIRTPRLTVPHSHMLQRSFVLYPLADLVPNLCFDNGLNLGEHLNKLEFDLKLLKKGI